MAAQHPDEERDEAPEDIQRDELDTARIGELFYPGVVEFVTERLVHLVPLPHPSSGRIWCPSWFTHAQALSRLDSLWRAWEYMRHDGALGMSNWWTHHVDPTMSALMDPLTGPFARCANGHERNEPLPLDDVPPGLFKDQRKKWLQSNNPFDLS